MNQLQHRNFAVLTPVCRSDAQPLRHQQCPMRSTSAIGIFRHLRPWNGCQKTIGRGVLSECLADVDVQIDVARTEDEAPP